MLVNSAHPLVAAAPNAPEQIRDAIRRQRTLRLRYGGFVRLVEPHALGLSAGGHRALLAWQIEGGSRSDPPSGWRTFLISEMTDVALTVRGFTPRPSYRGDRPTLRDIEIEVTLPPDAATTPPAKARG